MDTLPQELVHRIASFVERREGEAQALYHERKSLPANLPQLAVISRPWKEATEAITFRTLNITGDDLCDFQTVVSGARRAKVREISFSTILPTYSDEDCGRHETIGDQNKNNERFSQSLEQLFNIFKSWENDSVQGTVGLHMSEVYSPMDPQKREKPRYDYEIEVIQGKRVDIFEKRFEGNYIQLLEPERLPVISRIARLFINRLGLRAYAPCTAARIASRLPSLESINWDLVDLDDLIPDDVDSLDDIGTPEILDELDRSGQHMSFRCDRRKHLADALSASSLRSLNNAYIELYHEWPDQGRGSQSILPLESSVDPLSAALRGFSVNLTSFTVKGTIDPSLFWPPSESDARTTLAWPSLKTYFLTFDMTTPSGTWYFTRDPAATASPPSSPESHASEGHNNFRTYPESETIEPLLLAFGKAARRMPVLEVAALTCPLEDDERNKFQFEVSYFAPGQETYSDGNEDLQCRRVYYEVGDWRPSDALTQVLRGIGEEQHGGRATETFVESSY
jgi:hypothetical protein